MKKVISLIMISLMIIIMAGCENGIKGVELVSYPDKLIYIQNEDEKLDISGFRIIEQWWGMGAK